MKPPTRVATFAAVMIMAGCGGDSGRINGLDDPLGAADVVQGSAGSVTLRSASPAYTFPITWRFYSGAGCTGSAGSTLGFPAITSGGITFTPTTWLSMQVTAGATSSAGGEFTLWSGTDGLSSTAAGICIPAPDAPQVYTATYGQTGNSAPVLNAIGDRSAPEGALLAFTATATDAETPAGSLTYSVGAEAPAGVQMTSAGSFMWAPAEAQGPGAHTFNVCVHDATVPPLSDCEAITVNVTEVNQPPALDAIPDQVVDLGSTVTFVVRAADPDVPANSLTFGLGGAPAGATIDASSGAFLWTPAAGGTVTFDVTVHDDGLPPLSASRPVVVTVNVPAVAITSITPADGSAVDRTVPLDVTAEFSSPGSQNPVTCQAVAEAAGSNVMGSQGTGSGSCTSTISFDAAGVFTVTYTARDSHGMSDSRTLGIVVYDPAAGSVTASGWLGAGAGGLDNGRSGSEKSVFTLSSKYVGRSSVPTGHVALQLGAAGLNFRGLTQEWLVVDPAAGSATLRGVGRIVGESGDFGFLVWMRDDAQVGADEVRIRIWRDSDENDVIYDNGANRVVGGGAVNIIRAGSR